MIIAQISDVHLTMPGAGIDPVVRTGRHFERAVAHLNALRPRPDVVLLTGDLVDHGQADEYERLRGMLEPLAMPVHLIPGNHDDRANLVRVFDHHRYLPRDGGFIQYAVEGWPVRLLALDTLVPGEDGGLLCPVRLAWLDERLMEAPDQPTLVFMHHPPFTTGIHSMDDMGLDGSEALAAVVRRHPQVERIVCGHLHRPIVRRFASTVACTCPATAHQVALDLPPATRLAVVMEPPACLLHVWLGEQAGLVTHVSVIGDERPPFTVFDGTSWLKDAAPPPSFHPRPA
jgi:3',5'-cyclic AMP phosphodiesterase CpdA